MVEGRISSSVFVGAGTDLGGGASTLGVLSGGNSQPISVGRNCLLEVNSALGIPVGDAVILAAEVAPMASSLVKVNIEGHPLNGRTVKAVELLGINAATFRRNNATGELEVVRAPQHRFRQEARQRRGHPQRRPAQELSRRRAGACPARAVRARDHPPGPGPAGFCRRLLSSRRVLHQAVTDLDANHRAHLDQGLVGALLHEFGIGRARVVGFPHHRDVLGLAQPGSTT
jgi:hypothetical protein